MNKIITAIIIVAVLVAGFYTLNAYIYNDKQGDQKQVLSHKDATYVIDGEVYTLRDGRYEGDIAESSANIILQYFGNELKKDLDGDGREDVVFLVTHSTGGTGTFYYVVAALNTENGYVGTKGFAIGDRIAPQSTVSGNGRSIVVNYADRKPTDGMADAPTVGKSVTLLLNDEKTELIEVANLEGEADPSVMKLDMKKWVWMGSKQAGKFTITFAADKRFTATTDCNSMFGSYDAAVGKITFGQIGATKMYCEGSQETEFANMLQAAQSYEFTSRGELILKLKTGGNMTFR